MRLKYTITILILILLLNSCTWLNPYLYFQGDSGDKTTLPIAIEELIEFAGYCDEAYQRANDENKLYEIRDNEFSIFSIFFSVLCYFELTTRVFCFK